MSEQDRRTAPRFIVNLPGRIGKQGSPLNVINLSSVGALILSDRSFTAWEDLYLELELEGERILRLPANVCWCEAGLAGLKFTSLEAEAAAYLELYLQRLAAVGAEQAVEARGEGAVASQGGTGGLPVFFFCFFLHTVTIRNNACGWRWRVVCIWGMLRAHDDGKATSGVYRPDCAGAGHGHDG